MSIIPHLKGKGEKKRKTKETEKKKRLMKNKEG